MILKRFTTFTLECALVPVFRDAVQLVEVAAGNTLFSYGDVSDRLFFIVNGSLDIVRRVKRSKSYRYPIGLHEWGTETTERIERVVAAQFSMGTVLGAELTLLLPREKVLVPSPRKVSQRYVQCRRILVCVSLLCFLWQITPSRVHLCLHQLHSV